MPFKFVTNRIYTGKPTKTIEQIIKEAKASNEGLTKTAASTTASHATVEGKLTKEAKFPAGHEHKFKANAAKLKGTGGKGAEVKETDKPDKDSEVKEGCDAVAKTEVEVKVAAEKEKGVETYDAGKKEGTDFANDAKKEPDAKSATKATGGDPKAEPKKGKDGLPESGQPQWEGKQENVNNPFKDPKATDHKKAAVELSVPSGPFMIVAKMKPEEKKRLKDYWMIEFPADYAEAMTTDK